MKTLVRWLAAVALACIMPGVGLAGPLEVGNLRVGRQGRPVSIAAKVMQIVDDGQMLVGLEDRRGNRGGGRYGTWVLIKCSTVGMADGHTWQGSQWTRVTGAVEMKVTGTLTYPTAGGATRTVFVLEPVK